MGLVNLLLQFVIAVQGFAPPSKTTDKQQHQLALTTRTTRLLKSDSPLFIIGEQQQQQQQSKNIQRSSKSSDEEFLEAKILELASAQEVDYKELEKQILASAQAQVDYNSVVNALSFKNNNSNNNDINTGAAMQDFFASTARIPSSTWRVSLAASIVFYALSFFLFHSTYVSAFVFVLVFFMASVDPVEDDNVLGAVARMVGRETLQTYESSVEPKARAMARAAVTGQEEIAELQQRIHQLERENAQLARWKNIRQQAEEALGDFTVDELKQVAREHDLPPPVKGGGRETKLQLLVRLLEANVLAIPQKAEQGNNKNMN